MIVKYCTPWCQTDACSYLFSCRLVYRDLQVGSCSVHLQADLRMEACRQDDNRYNNQSTKTTQNLRICVLEFLKKSERLTARGAHKHVVCLLMELLLTIKSVLHQLRICPSFY